MSVVAVPRELSNSSTASATRAVEWTYWGALALVLAVPMGLGLYRLDMPSFWFDEAVTWLSTSNGWLSVWLSAAAGEDCGGFIYTVFIKMWAAVFGYGEFSLRLPSVLFAAGAAAVLLQIGRDMGNLRLGIFMGLAVGMHPSVVCWSRQARAYSLEVFLTSLYLWSLLAYARDGRRKQAWLLAVVGSLLSLTHVFGVFVVAGGTLFLLVLRFAKPADADGERVRRSLWPTVATVSLLSVWVFFLQGRVRQNLESFWIGGSIADRYLDVARNLVPFLMVGAPLVALGLILMTLRRDRVADRRLQLAVVFISLCVWLGPAVASSLSKGDHHFILARYFMPGVVPVAVVLGYFFAALPRFVGLPAFLALSVAALNASNLAGFYYDHGYDEGRARAAVQHMVQNFRKGDQVFVSPAHEYATLAYYGVPNRMVQGAGGYLQRQPLVDLLRKAPADTRKWIFVYNCTPEDDLRDVGLQDAKQERFGTITLVLTEPQP